MTRHTVAFLTVLAVFLCLGLGEKTAAAAEGIENRKAAADATEKIAGIVKAAAKYSGCGAKPLLEKPACYREFADKAIRVGVGVGVAGYAIHYLHKDSTQHFANLRKELAGFEQLKEAVKQDPSKIADPATRAEAEKRIHAAYTAAREDVDHRLAKVNQTIQTVLALAEVTVAFLQIIFALAAIVGDPEFQKAAKSIRTGLEGMGKDFGQINAGLRQMSRAMDDMNKSLGEVNGALEQMNQGIGQANKGMEELNQGIGQANKGMGDMNRGIGQANKGMDELNKHVPGIKKGAEKLKEMPGIEFDFSHIKDTWSSGTSGLDADEQQRRMGLLLDLMPGIGDGKGVIEAVTGKDLATEEELSGLDRAMGALVVLRWLKVGKKVLTGDHVRDARKATCVAGSVTDNSFPAGTLVLMGDGTSTPIERIREGDKVLATDPETGHTRPEPVTDLITGSGDKRLVTVTVDTDGTAGDRTDTITATDHHPFRTLGPDGWTYAVDLTPGAWLRTSTGTSTQIIAVDASTVPQTVHNLTVARLHTYYVLAGSTPVLVHNAKKNKCSLEIDHVGQVDQDWVTKGAHVNMKDGMEVVLRPDGKGGIRGEAFRLSRGIATQKQVDAVIATIKSDPKVRADMIRVTKGAKEVFESSAKAMKEGRNPQWRFSNDRTAELQALIEAMEKM
ncbi:polymorphic toxin-type HINT domain-containing protein [Streptomyces flavidovirens]|uniref:polymorphic toxin-type HINT domain-containing protein n=1 Tax=Streptomyces flavidovirens TaxID=67298 RepID=UPI000687ECF6|nr:polymorphic toxin-type HINT domain-containing protein [Streptomyces flavidovirens]